MNWLSGLTGPFGRLLRLFRESFPDADPPRIGQDLWHAMGRVIKLLSKKHLDYPAAVRDFREIFAAFAKGIYHREALEALRASAPAAPAPARDNVEDASTLMLADPAVESKTVESPVATPSHSVPFVLSHPITPGQRPWFRGTVMHSSIAVPFMVIRIVRVCEVNHA